MQKSAFIMNKTSTSNFNFKPILNNNKIEAKSTC